MNPTRGRAGAGDGVDADRRWMRRALTLAHRGWGTTRPNPMVGAVLVRGGRVLAEGFHVRAGEPHAEVKALEALKRAGGRAAGATIYVNLEPCAHTGRTAPCVNALIEAGVARVVVGIRDPNPLVDGRGLARLRRAGIRVDVGCLSDECQALNRAFLAWVSLQRPLVTLKIAATLDGFIADGRRRDAAAPIWITGPEARQAAHQLRAEHDAVLVGAGTVMADNPRLTVRLPAALRSKRAGQPLRVILDGKLRISPSAAVLPARAGARTLVIGAVGAPARRVEALRRAGAEVELLAGRDGTIAPAQVLRALAGRGIQSVLVEGGAGVAGAFIAAGLVDRVSIFHAPLLLGGGLAAATGLGREVSRALRLGRLRVRALGEDLVTEAEVV